MRRRCPDCKKRRVAEGRSYCQPCNTRRVREWREANTERHRARQREWNEKKKLEIIARYGGRCACCGETERAFLTFDHKNGGGNAARRKYRSQAWKLIIREGYPDTYQVLCYNCNNAKAHGGCPHKRRR